jgi:hypothetical protein
MRRCPGELLADHGAASVPRSSIERMTGERTKDGRIDSGGRSSRRDLSVVRVRDVG